jgi:formylglycine-generating enzyme required for sulfatase activity
MSTTDRKLRIFLCHASQDKPVVRELYQRLLAEGWIDPWLDEEKLLPGQDWDLEIEKAVEDADAVIVCLSNNSVTKEGYVQKELRKVLDVADEKPVGTIFIIPLRIDDCQVPRRLKVWQWVDYSSSNAYSRLLKSLHIRTDTLKLRASAIADSLGKQFTPSEVDLCRLIKIPPKEEAPYSFFIGKYPVTNIQYQRFLDAPDFSDELLWIGFPKFNEDCVQIGQWGNQGWSWLLGQIKRSSSPVKPRDWDDEKLGISHPENPVVGISWFEANAYCNWLERHWFELAESHANSSLRTKQIRLPLDIEWLAAAGGLEPNDRFPWDLAGEATEDVKEIVKRTNIWESGNLSTTPVRTYPNGASPYGVIDMVGNVWEWQANKYVEEVEDLCLRGGSYNSADFEADLFSTHDFAPASSARSDLGFRVMCTI